jgi:hypothetical protein
MITHFEVHLGGYDATVDLPASQGFDVQVFCLMTTFTWDFRAVLG